MVNEYHIVNVSPLFIPWSDLRLGKFKLNQFQTQVYRHLSAGKDLLVYAPTGAGKTLTVLLSPGFPDEDMPGFISLYPNNTLLANQMDTVGEIIREALGGRIVETDPLCSPENAGKGVCRPSYVVYGIREKHTDTDKTWKYVILVALSGRYIVSENGVPKREVLYRIAEKVYRYNSRGGAYLVVFATPDTLLLTFTGAYRDFRLVGATLHNILVALASGIPPESLEDVLRHTEVATRSQLSDIITVRKRLLTHPLFIDEFHLYGAYEVDALYAILKLFRQETGLPVVFSSATPAHDTLEELKDAEVMPETIESPTSDVEGFPVRGPMEIRVIPIVSKRKGLAAYYEVGEEIPSYISRYLLGELNQHEGKTLIILDRLWMVTETARTLRDNGIPVECIASMVEEVLCTKGASVIVGSEATTQGVNLGKVVLGVTGGVSAEDVIQRIGRIGRKGVASRVYLFIPKYKLSESPPPVATDYYGLVKWVSTAYPDYSKRKRDVSKLLPENFHEARRKLIYSLAIASEARVAGNKEMLKKIDLTDREAWELLNKVIGGPEALAKLVVFRRMGFTVRYMSDTGGQGGKESIGLITRNFLVKDVLRDGTLVISFKPMRSLLTLHASVNPKHLRGRFILVRHLLEILDGWLVVSAPGKEVRLESIDPDTLAYVGDLGSELSDYLSYTGEGAKIVHGTSGSYAAVFV